jgi:hypothetical protein
MAKPPASSPAPAEITIPTYLQPAAIQADITMFAPMVLGMISTATKGAIHDVAEGMLELADGAVTVAEIEQLMTDAKISVPAADVWVFGLLLNAALAGINIAIVKYGADAPEVAAYLEGISDGLLAAGF